RKKRERVGCRFDVAGYNAGAPPRPTRPAMPAVLRAAALCWLLLAAPLAAAEPDQAAFFESRVRPLLAERCVGCHGPKKQSNSLPLASREEMWRGGERGPAVKPGEPDGSLLIRAVRHDGERKMPPKEKLKPAEVEALTAWVKMGAPWPQTVASSSDDPTRHWAF